MARRYDLVIGPSREHVSEVHERDACAALLGAVGCLDVAPLAGDIVGRLEAGRAAVLVVFELIAAVLTVAWFNEQPITAATWLGAVLITAAAVMAGWPERPQLALNRSEV